MCVITDCVQKGANDTEQQLFKCLEASELNIVLMAYIMLIYAYLICLSLSSKYFLNITKFGCMHSPLSLLHTIKYLYIRMIFVNGIFLKG